MMKKVLVLLLCGLSLTGCSSFKGGMPTVPFNTKEDLGYIKEQMSSSASVKTFYDSPSVQTRNKFVASRLFMTNLEYLKFIKGMSANETQINSASDILVLSLDIASVAFTPVGTKTLLSSISAITGGSRLSINKNAYPEKTMSALIAAMNAERKEVLKRIIRGTKQDLNNYTFEQALSDLNDYYLAGTFYGALTAIQRDASVKEHEADTDIQRMSISR